MPQWSEDRDRTSQAAKQQKNITVRNVGRDVTIYMGAYNTNLCTFAPVFLKRKQPVPYLKHMTHRTFSLFSKICEPLRLAKHDNANLTQKVSYVFLACPS